MTDGTGDDTPNLRELAQGGADLSASSQLNISDILRQLEWEGKKPEKPWDAGIRRVKDVVLFSVTLLIVLVSLFGLWEIFADQASSADDKKWAMTLVSGIISGFMGWLVGKKA